MSFDGRLFCGQNDQGFAINGVTYAWPVTQGLTWSLGISRLGPLSDLDLKQMYTEIFAEIAKVVDFDVKYTSNWRVANFVAQSRRLDGPSNVLAQNGIPMPHYDLSSQLVCEWDDSEAWGLFENPPPDKIDAWRVGMHETLHAVGLGHGAIDRNDPALIEPQYNRLVRYMQRRDKKELLRRYKPAKGTTPVTPQIPPAPSAPGSKRLTVKNLEIVDAEGRLYKLSGSVGPQALMLEE